MSQNSLARNYSPFNINKFIPCSVLYYIIKKFIFVGLNGKKINEELNQYYGHKLEEHSLYDFLLIFVAIYQTIYMTNIN